MQENGVLEFNELKISNLHAAHIMNSLLVPKKLTNL